MKDIRITIPVITDESVGQQAPDGLLFPNFSRLEGQSTDGSPQALSGILKLVQQVYLEIMTEPQPNGVGSGLASQLRDANIDDVSILARSGVSDLLIRLLRYQDGLNLPKDERLFDLQVQSIDLDETTNKFVLSLLLTSEARESYVIQPPLV